MMNMQVYNVVIKDLKGTGRVEQLIYGGSANEAMVKGGLKYRKRKIKRQEDQEILYQQCVEAIVKKYQSSLDKEDQKREINWNKVTEQYVQEFFMESELYQCVIFTPELLAIGKGDLW